MDTGVAVRTSCIKSPGPLGWNNAARLRIDSVALMALETQKRFPCVEKPIVNRTMRTVAVETVLGHIGMFIKEWTSLLSMALDTGFPRILHGRRDSQHRTPFLPGGDDGSAGKTRPGKPDGS